MLLKNNHKKMFRKIFLIVMLACTGVAMAQSTFKDLRPLHVDGNQLCDDAGNRVVLHGVMDTPNPYFNSYRWYNPWGGQGSMESNYRSCITYFDKLFTAITDHKQGAYCNLFRLHLDPCWTNDPSKHSDGEHDISAYSGARLSTYMKTLFWKIAEKGLGHGLYIIMRPPGVCPEKIQVGDAYQKYLIDVWDRVSKNDSIQKYAGYVSIELANEPRTCLDAKGGQSDTALRDFFQPVVDKIRANGFKGIILVPGAGYQSSYASYAKYPIIDENYGFAVHNYSGWYDCSDDHCDPANAIKKFAAQVPVIGTNPIVITEVDWSPLRMPLEFDHVNEWGQNVYKNYGTWATGSTSKWGKAYRAILDHFGNVGMTLTGTGDYINIDRYINNKKVEPAFMDRDNPDEACGVTCFKWYEEFYKVNYPSAERYQYQSIPEDPFERTDGWFNDHILFENNASHAKAVSTVKVVANGCVGWRFDDPEGLDLSGYKSVTFNLARNGAKGAELRIYDNSHNANFWDDHLTINMTGQKTATIDLQNMVSDAGKAMDPAHIRIACFYNGGAEQTFYIRDVEFEADPTAVDKVAADAKRVSKVMRKGSVVVRNGEKEYNINGVRAK